MKKIERKTNSASDSVTTGGEFDEPKDGNMFLSTQNKTLVKEIRKYKRQLTQSRRELQLMRDKSREMESLVSVIQRAWSQLDVDSSLLLDSLGDVESIDNNSDERLGIMKLFLSSGSDFQHIDPISLSNTFSPVKLSEWSTLVEIETERKKSLGSIISSKKNDENDMDESEHDEKQDLLSKLDEHLMSHSSFTLNLLNRLCVLINEFGSDSLLKSADTLQSISQWKAWSAEKLYMETKIEKLSSEIINLQADNHILKIERNRAERIIDNLKEEVEMLKLTSSQPTSASTTLIITSSSNTTDGSGISYELSSAIEKELKEKITILESQLQESESAKAKVEMTLTERLARPLAQTDAQLVDMRKSMEELRQQFKQRVSSLLADSAALQEKVYDQEQALQTLESSCSSRCQEMVALTRMEIDRIHQERVKIQASLSSAQTELSCMNQLKSQLEDHQAVADANNAEIKRLQDRMKTYTERLSTAEKSLSSSREREVKLEQRIHQSTIDAEHGQIVEGIDGIALQGAATRTHEMQQELDGLKISMEDLILEIDSISSSERKAREHVIKLQAETNNNQNVHRGVLNENLRLHDAIVDADIKVKAAEAKAESCSNIAKQQDRIIHSLRAELHNFQAEIQKLTKSLHEVKAARIQDEQALLEAQQTSSLAEHTIESNKKRHLELQARCTELGKKLEVERKLRMDMQRETKPKKKGSEQDAVIGSSNMTSGNMKNEDVEMLEITLGMLRCSVCRDRFKEVAITRCFHLFCKECIDVSIRNRSRKCPSCGEKFGQDDVKTIYFN